MLPQIVNADLAEFGPLEQRVKTCRTLRSSRAVPTREGNTHSGTGTPFSRQRARRWRTSRAFDNDGNIQPAPDDPLVASRATYWESNQHITRRVMIV